MTTLKALTASLCVAFLTAPNAFASAITNRDDTDQKVTIIEGNAATDHILRPLATLKEVCNKGCVIRLNGNQKDEYELKGSEVVSIEGGYLYYAGPPASAVPQAGDADQPHEPSPK
ncbi:conserved exported protein of unknown function [Hyphomicrobium sp. 1Nfss2.1]|uniref:hypothetical protein n=1 Tax=Hyphomicrobium sp. 1Nfss2.1 TaxID=3413936 RepID=UPI003C79B955